MVALRARALTAVRSWDVRLLWKPTGSVVRDTACSQEEDKADCFALFLCLREPAASRHRGRENDESDTKGTVKTMAIFHLEAKVITRSVGRSAVAASAYMSCSKVYNDYDGIQHDYTRKRGLVWQRVFLPVTAPDAWQDR